MLGKEKVTACPWGGKNRVDIGEDREAVSSGWSWVEKALPTDRKGWSMG
jgi:hypothetical protein